MILAKGEKVIFKLETGRTVRLPVSHAILHDVDGQHFGKCEILLGPARVTQRYVEPKGAAKDYFGQTYDLRLINTPNIPPLGTFREIGLVTQIDYVRHGRYRGLYWHPFKYNVHPMLSKSGRWYGLNLGKGCLYDDRGIVFP